MVANHKQYHGRGGGGEGLQSEWQAVKISFITEKAVGC